MSTKISWSKNDPVYFLHAAIVVFFMFGFKYLPPFGGITEIGMGVVGVFLGVLWGWSFCEQAWPSLLSLIAMGFTGYTSVGGALTGGFGHSNVILVFSVLVLVYMIDSADITKLLAYKVINMKIGRGHPWILTFLIIYGTWLMAAFAGLFATIVIMYNLFFKICDIYNIKKGSRYGAYMVAGITFACIMSGGQAFPWKPPVVMFMGAYQGVSGNSFDYFDYTVYIWVSHFLMMLLYVLAGKFLIRPDVSAIANVNEALIEEQGKLDYYQKIMIGVFGVFLLCLFCPSVLPKTWKIVALLNTLGTSGIAITLIIILLILNFARGSSLKETMTNAISWDVIFLVASVMIVANALGNEATGVSTFLVNILTPVFGGKSMLVFLILVTILPALITGFCNNLVVGMVFIPIAYSFCIAQGVNHLALAVMLCNLCSIAMLTAAGCAPAAMMYGQKDWITAKQGFLYGILAIFCVWIPSFVTMPMAFWWFS